MKFSIISLVQGNQIMRGITGAVFSLMILTACNSLIAPTLTPIASATTEPTATKTATFTPTSTSTPTPTSTPVPASQPISPINVDQVTLLTHMGKGYAEQAVYSQDGKFLAVASTGGVYLYDAHSLDELKLIATDVGVTCIALAPDDQILATGSSDSNVRLWSISDGTLLRVLEGHKGSITAIAFSPNGQTLASSGGYYTSNLADNIIRLWHVSDGSLLYKLEGHSDMVYSLAFTPDNQVLASGSRDGTVRLWQVTDGTMLRMVWGYGGISTISPDGQILATDGINGQVQLRRVSDGKLIRTFLPDHTGYIFSLAFSPDSQKLASGWSDTWDGTGINAIQLWQVSEGTLLRSINGLDGRITSLSFTPDGQTLASRDGGLLSSVGIQIGKVQLWHVGDGTLLHTLDGYNNFTMNAAFSPDGQYLVEGMRDGKLQLWRVNGSNIDLFRTLDGYLEGGGPPLDNPRWRYLKRFTLALAPDGQTLALGGFYESISYPTVRIWSLSNGELLHSLNANTSGVGVEDLAFAPDGQSLAVAYGNYPTSTDNSVRLWRVSDGMLLHTLTGHEKPVDKVVFSPDGQLLATASEDGTIRLWQVDTGNLLQILKSYSYIVAFSHDGRTLAAGLHDGEVQLWRVSDWILLATLERKTAGITNNVIWNTQSGIASITSLAFTPDDQLLAVGSNADSIVRLWRVGDGVLLRELDRFSNGAWDLTFTLDGRFLIVAMEDGTINLWGTPPR